jgi:AcrR family transcriptional regulator/predicted DNA-binding transcriptional regulator AlpA
MTGRNDDQGRIVRWLTINFSKGYRMPSDQFSTSKSLKISDLCVLTGLSKPTIIHYINMELLPPPLKLSSNRHVYDEAHLKSLLMIRRFREEEGLSLPEIKLALADGRIPNKIRKRKGSPSSTATVPLPEEPVKSKRQLIIDKAIKLFSVHGYENVKISDITDAIQIGKGTFYLYFANKKELLYECFAAIKALLQSVENDASILMVENIVMRMRNRWYSLLSQYPHFGGIVQVLQTTAHSDDPVIRKKAIEFYKSIIQPLIDDLTTTKEKGLIAPIDPELTAYAIIGIWENVTFRIIQDDDYSCETAANIIEELMKRILMPVTP